MKTGNNPQSFWRAVVFAVPCALILYGCGPRLITPKGRVLKAGSPVPLKKEERLRIAFFPEDETVNGGDSLVASIRTQDTAFYVSGRKGKGIPPGKYRVAVALNKGTSERDLWNGRFARDKTPFVFDLKTDKEEVVIDLPADKP